MYTLPFFLLLSLVATLAGAITIEIPLDQQLPQIARIGEPFTWSFAPGSFNSTKGPITYTVPSSLPKWMSFDSDSLTFRGTPGPKDEGTPSISVTAHDTSSSVSSRFKLCVTHFPPPSLHIPIKDQFRSDNPSLSSVFLMDDHSNLKSGIPALRVPPGWSFSIGLDPDTFMSPNNLYYDALSADGTPLPDWVVFRPSPMTFNGVAPYIKGTRVYTLALHASDQEGFTASVVPFNLVVSTEEVLISSAAFKLPTINVTAETPTSVSLTSAVDFTGFLIDGRPLDTSDIKELSVDTSAYSWLKYDSDRRILSGTPPAELTRADTPLPVKIVTSSDRSVETSLSISVVPSFFSASTLPAIMSDEEGKVKFDLSKFFSNQPKDDVALSVSFNVSGAAQFLHFESNMAVLEGRVPASFAQDVSVTFAAYSRITHSTSHTRADVHFPESRAYVGGPSSEISDEDVKAKKHRAMVIALAVTFALVGGIGLFVVLALVRRCMRTKDTALVGVEAFDKLPDADKQWYLQNDEEARGERGPGIQPPGPRASMYGNLGMGRPFSPPTRAPLTGDGSFMNKGAFVSKINDKGLFVPRIQDIKAGIRRVSDRVRRPQRTGRPTISKPSQSAQASESDFSIAHSPPIYGDMRSRSLDQTSYASSMPLSLETTTSAMATSPTSSTGMNSLPLRREDEREFVPPLPNKPPQLRRQASSKASMGSPGNPETLDDDEDEFDEGEGVVMHVTKAGSLRSARGSLSPARRPRGPPEIKVTAGSQPGRSAIPTRYSPTARTSPESSEYQSSPSVPQGLQAQLSMPPLSLRPRVMPFTNAHHNQVDLPRERVVSQSAHRVYTPLIAGESEPASIPTFRTIHARAIARKKFHQVISTNEPSANSQLTVRLVKGPNGKALPAFMYKNNGRFATRAAGYIEFNGDAKVEDRGTYTVDIVTLVGGVVVGRMELVVE